MSNYRLNLTLAGMMLISTVASADLINDKITLKPNMTLKYNTKAKSVDTLNEMFSEGDEYF